MTSTNTKYKRGDHPNSRSNLNFHNGRPQAYDEPKKQRYLSVTETGWQGMQRLASQLGCNSVSELLEQMGRSQIPVGENHG